MTDQAHTDGGAPGALDTVKLLTAIAILVGGIAAFYLLGTYPLVVRWVIVFATLAAGFFVALQSAQGIGMGSRGAAAAAHAPEGNGAPGKEPALTS